MLKADASCFWPTLVEVFSREWQEHKNQKGYHLWRGGGEPLASHRQVQKLHCQLRASPPVKISRKWKYEWLWSYLCVYLIFCYSFQEFELLLIWRPVSGSSSLWMGLCQAASNQRIRSLGLWWQGASEPGWQNRDTWKHTVLKGDPHFVSSPWCPLGSIFRKNSKKNISRGRLESCETQTKACDPETTQQVTEIPQIGRNN